MSLQVSCLFSRYQTPCIRLLHFREIMHFFHLLFNCSCSGLNLLKSLVLYWWEEDEAHVLSSYLHSSYPTNFLEVKIMTNSTVPTLLNSMQSRKKKNPVSSSEKRELYINIYTYIYMHIWSIQSQFLLSSSYDTARDDGRKLKSRKFQLNKRKLSFCCLWGWSSTRILCPELLWSLCALNHPWNWENLTGHSDRQSALVDPAWVGKGVE